VTTWGNQGSSPTMDLVQREWDTTSVIVTSPSNQKFVMSLARCQALTPVVVRAGVLGDLDGDLLVGGYLQFP
jgi:hypothetical protein